MSVGNLAVVALVCIVVAAGTHAVTISRRQNRETTELLVQYAQADLETIHHLRRTMEDLRDRDPVIAQTVELGLADLAQREPVISAMARQDWTALRRMRHEQRNADDPG